MASETETSKAVSEQPKAHAPVKHERGEAKFSRERVLGADGFKLVGQPVHVIAGALHGDKGKEFTREDLAAKVDAYLKREVENEESAR